MKKILFILCTFLSFGVFAQTRPNKILGDTVQFYSNSTKGSTLQILNKTKDTLGFLYNTGNGITIFKKALKKINDTTYVIGNDTLRTHTGSGGSGSGAPDTIKSKSPLYVIIGGPYDSLAIYPVTAHQNGYLDSSDFNNFSYFKQAADNYLSYSIPFASTSFSDSTLVSQLTTPTYYFNNALWLNGSYTGGIDNSRLIAYKYGYLISQEFSQRLIFQVGDSSTTYQIGLGIKGAQTLANTINLNCYLSGIIGDSTASSMVNTCNGSTQSLSSGILINYRDIIELQVNQIADSVEFFYRNITNNNSFRIARKIDFSLSPVYNSVGGYPTFYYAKGNIRPISWAISKPDFDMVVLGNSQTEGHRADYDSGYIRILQNYTGLRINNMAKAAATSADYLNTIKDNFNFHNKTIAIAGLTGNDLVASFSAAQSKANYIALVNRLRAKGCRIIHVDNPYRTSNLGAGTWADLQALNRWIDTTYKGIDTIVHVQDQTQTNYALWYADGAHLNNTGNLGLANILLNKLPDVFNIQNPIVTTSIDTTINKPTVKDTAGREYKVSWNNFTKGLWSVSGTDIKNDNSGAVLVGSGATAHSAALSVFHTSIPIYAQGNNNGTATIRVQNLNTGTNAAAGLRFLDSTGNVASQILLGSANYSLGANNTIFQSVLGDATIASNSGNINLNAGTASTAFTRLRINPSGKVGIGSYVDAISTLHVIGSTRVTDTAIFTGLRSSTTSPTDLMVVQDSITGVLSHRAIPSSGGGSMTWPAAAGIAVYAGGSAWGTSITDNSANWNTVLNRLLFGTAATKSVDTTNYKIWVRPTSADSAYKMNWPTASQLGGVTSNIYTADGSLLSNRTISGTKKLTFSFSSASGRYIPTSIFDTASVSFAVIDNIAFTTALARINLDSLYFLHPTGKYTFANVQNNANQKRIAGFDSSGNGQLGYITIGSNLTLSGGVLSATGGSGITALTGDVTASGSGSVSATLATVNSNVGSFTNANITVDAKGRITAASTGSGGSGSTFQQVLAIATLKL